MKVSNKIFFLAATVFVFGGMGSAWANPFCAYQLVTFERPAEGRLGYGLSLPGQIVPERLLDVTNVVEARIAEVAREQRLSGETALRRAFTDPALVSRLSAIQCRYRSGIHDVPLRSVRRQDIRAAIPQPLNVVAVGQNTRSIVSQFGLAGPDGRVFSKRIPLSGAYSDVLRPAKAIMDGEVELGVVIRKRIEPGTRITRQNLAEFVAGFVLANDVTNFAPIVLELFDGGFSIAKTYPSFLPVGPYYVPIEAMIWNERLVLPRLSLERESLRLNPSTGQAVRFNHQVNEVSDAEYFADIPAAIENILAKREQRERHNNGQMESLLINGALEAGDLILMGSSAGVAFRAPTHARNWRTWIFASGHYQHGSAFEYFYPVYSRFFAPGNSGGPWPVNGWEHWLAHKMHIVRLEYCDNHSYLVPDDVMLSRGGILGVQIAEIVPAREQPLQGMNEYYTALDRDRFARLCGASPDWRWQAWAGTAGFFVSTGGGATGGYLLGARLTSSRGRLLRWLVRGGTTTAGTAAGLIGGTWLYGRGAYAAEASDGSGDEANYWTERLLDAAEPAETAPHE